MQLVKEGRIILNLEDAIKANHTSSQTRELCILQSGNLEPVILLDPWLLNPNMQERSFPVTFLDKTVNITSCSEVEEETDEEKVPARRII